MQFNFEPGNMKGHIDVRVEYSITLQEIEEQMRV